MRWLTPLSLACLCASGVIAKTPDSGVFINGAVDDNIILWEADHDGLNASGEGVRISKDQGIRFEFNQPNAYGELQVSSPDGWDLNAYVALAIDLENTGERPLQILGKLNHNQTAASLISLAPDEQETLVLYLFRKQNLSRFEGMNSAPGGDLRFWGGYDTLTAHSLQFVGMGEESPSGQIAIHRIRAIGKYGQLSPEIDAFFPFIDRFGQYAHADWENKVHSKAQLKRLAQKETALLEACTSVSGWSRYGGWKDGTQLEASGHFRTAKHAGKWWLVDPEGYLFWSIGVNGIRFGNATPTDAREHYFSVLPDGFHNNGGANFANANMALKYGSNWQQHAALLSHKRMAAWGLNTCGNWSSPDIYGQRKTSYVIAIGLGPSKGEAARALRGDETALRERIAQQLTKVADSANDPWCIGYFVDNELKWDYVPDIEMYYRVVSEEIDKAAPNKLYLGSRIHNNHTEALAASARYCDVISINCYAHEPIATTHDKPYIIGEFHFGSLDRGLCSTGLRSAGSQRQRANSYKFYMRECMKRANIVGAHWFTFREQAYTGRGDGENFQVGLVDICDTPYDEMVNVIRSTAETLYPFRFSYESSR